MMKRDVRWFHMIMLVVVACGAMGRVARGGCEPTWHPMISDGQTGVALGNGSPGHVYAMADWHDDLIVGGSFDTAGGQQMNNIARWDGSAWHPLASGGQTGVDGVVFALIVWNGDLIAGGLFTTAGGQTVNRIARWDGSSWHALGSDGGVGVDEGGVWALTVWNGNLIAGGKFITAGGQVVNGILRWDGATWHPLASGDAVGVEDGFVLALRAWNGDLVVGGGFQDIGDQSLNGIARWDGKSWFPLDDGTAAGVQGLVKSLAIWKGNLLVGGSFIFAGQQTVYRIARWDGTAWHQIPCRVGSPGLAAGEVLSMTIWNDHLVAGGEFLAACGNYLNRIARWDGSQWHPFVADGPIGVSHTILALTEWNGEIIAGGRFATAGGQQVNAIARWGCPPHISGDINGDGQVGVVDLLAVLSNWGPCADPENCPADIAPPGPPQGDDQVNVLDLLFIINNWG